MMLKPNRIVCWTWMVMMAGAALATAAEKPNVVIVLVDDQGYGDLSCHGHPFLKTPHIDRLHSGSIRLTDFHAAPMCTPTRGQLLTGRDALDNGAMNVSSGRANLRRGIDTMADHFAAAGYATGLFGKWHLGDNYPYRPQDRGFGRAIWFPSSHIPSASDRWNNDYFNPWLRTQTGEMRRFEGYCTDVYFDQAVRWMDEQRRAGKPFLAYVPLNAAHGPLYIHDRYRALFPQCTRAEASFFGMIVNIDENIGRLDQYLASAGLMDDTIVIYMTDNGGTAGVKTYNAGMRGRKIELYDGGHRVPCFIRWPGGRLGAARDVGALTQAQDVLPTLLELCGVAAKGTPAFDGVSLAPLLLGQTTELHDRMLVVQFSRMDRPQPGKGDAAVLWGKWRLVGGKELYDVGKDPGQHRDVAADHPQVVARMNEHYERWWADIEPRVNEFSPVTIGSEAENPTLLSPTDWADSFLDQSAQVRSGLNRNGVWHLEVARDGRYRIELRRWAREADLPLSASSPEFQAVDAVYPAGKALPIAGSRLRVGSLEQAKAAGPGDRAAVYEVDLKRGRTTMHSVFHDAAGREICGAYYVYVERLP
jgi:arylsulfatase